MNAIDRIIDIAKNEIGYLEKRSNSSLYDKTANAGSNNYTKYWAEIMPEYQGQPWCACFVTWCFVQSFGDSKARKLLKHYPFVYCPTMTKLFKLNANPKRGDIVMFYRGGEFVHTGIVTNVSGDYFETIEGNTSNGHSIVPNGGGVCKKSYYNSNLPGTKFCTPDYGIINNFIDNNEEILNMTQYEELKQTKQDKPMIYNYMDNNMPDWAKPTIQKLMDKKWLVGDEGKLGLTMDMIKMFVVNDRAGLYD